MRLSDLNESEIKSGLRLKSKTDNLATIVAVNHLDRELWCEILFENKTHPTGMFITWMDKFDFEVLDNQIIATDVQLIINSYPKCKCKDCSK